jgi:hypothetical protein
MYIAKIVEDGRKLLTKPVSTIAEALRDGKRQWMTSRFDVVEIGDDEWDIAHGVYDGVRCVVLQGRPI